MDFLPDASMEKKDLLHIVNLYMSAAKHPRRNEVSYSNGLRGQTLVIVTKVEMKNCGIVIIAVSLSVIGCTSIDAHKRLNESPENIARGDPLNNTRVREYLQSVLRAPEGYEVKAYTRRAFSSSNKKNFFMFHMFYVYLRAGLMEHTLVFTATPKISEYDGCWMLDAGTDAESYNLFLKIAENPWQVEEYQDSKGRKVLDPELTTRKILERMDKGYTFFGPASVRNLPWYHLLWMTIIPPPFSPELLILFSIHSDNCISAILETLVFKEK